MPADSQICGEDKPRTVIMFGNRSVIRPKQMLDRAGGGFETFKQIGGCVCCHLLLFNCYNGRKALNHRRIKVIQMRERA